MSEHCDIVIPMLNTMRILPGPRYYTPNELTFRRHHMVLEIMGLFNDEIQKYRINTKDYDPLSFLLSSPYTNSESTDEGAQFNPILSIIKTLINPKYEYFKYHDKEGVKYAFWTNITKEEAEQRKSVYTDKYGNYLKMDTFFLMNPDNSSTSYMGAVSCHNSEDIVNKQNHIVEVFYVVKYWAQMVKKKCRGGSNVPVAFEPITKYELLPFEGGYSGDPNSKTSSYEEKGVPKLFGINVQSRQFQDLFNQWSTENQNSYWTYQSYTNILITLLLMEHELHHALIGRYSPIMQDAPDLLLQKDLDINGIPEMINMYEHYLNNGLPNNDDTEQEKKKKLFREQFPIESGQFGAEKVSEEYGWVNPLTNEQGHNAFFGHLTFRSRLFGIAVTVGHQKSTDSWEHTVLGLKTLNNPSDGDTDVVMDDNSAVVDFIEDIFNNKLKLKF